MLSKSKATPEPSKRPSDAIDWFYEIAVDREVAAEHNPRSSEANAVSRV